MSKNKNFFSIRFFDNATGQLVEIELADIKLDPDFKSVEEDVVETHYSNAGSFSEYMTKFTLSKAAAQELFSWLKENWEMK